MSPSDALYRAVCAAPHDDLPRLVFADWLEENGRGERAEFIRVQCRLANASPADADYVDLLEREAELKAILWRELDADRPALPAGIGWEPEHRGFAERLRFGSVVGEAGDIASVIANVARLRSAVPVAGWRFETISPEQLGAFANPDLTAGITSLETPLGDIAPSQALDFSTLTGGGCFPYLRRLRLRSRTEARTFAQLAAAGGLSSLEVLQLNWLQLQRPVHKPTWQGCLRELSLREGIRYLSQPFPRLHTLRVRDAHRSEASVFIPPDAMPSLASLEIGADGMEAAELLTQSGRRLANLSLRIPHSPEVIQRMLNTVGDRLQVLRVSGSASAVPGVFPSRGVAALRQVALGPIDGTLIPHNLLKGVCWRTLTSFEAPGCPFERGDTVQFLRRLVAPNLKHLNLKATPLGDEGAIALAENASLANLTRLNLSACRIGPAGVEALLNSPHLQRLIELNLYANNGGEALTPLTDTGVLPNLGLADVAANGVSDELRARLEQRSAIRAR